MIMRRSGNEVWESNGYMTGESTDRITGKRTRRKRKSRNRKWILLILVLILAGVVLYLLYQRNYIPHRKYAGKDFGITTYVSSKDKDKDGIDDQTDILESARKYVETEPKYRSQYYEGGYPDDGYGVCTDVVAFALLGAGYDLQKLVDKDRRNNPDNYEQEEPDPNIDFRRVRNLQVYFSHHVQSLTLDPEEIEEWQGGDIVVFSHHIGIVSDVRNSKGIPFVIHHGNPYQASYEEDILETWGQIIGHYRIS
ncbi:MAG: DUF1287 domain-containing protein [Clostridiales bacterium]|nr:DUF1287 domain-containing protein [Clostridiales bacterium]